MTPPEVELRPDGTCVLRHGDVERWRASPSFGDAASWNPFREAVVWHRAGWVVAAAGDRAHVLHLDTGESHATLHLAPDHFGHLAIVTLAAEGPELELLLVLGWHDAWAYAADASLLWHARNIAVDGITFDEIHGSVLRLRAEMDPPGGWFSVSLDAATGRELERHPAFLPGYVGLYGQGPDEPT